MLLHNINVKQTVQILIVEENAENGIFLVLNIQLLRILVQSAYTFSEFSIALVYQQAASYR